MRPTFVIVGANLADASAAMTLRDDGFDGDVVVIGAEAELPYERPPLSKAFLRGEVPFEKLLVRPADFYREREIELRLGVRVSKVDVVARSMLGKGQPYDEIHWFWSDQYDANLQYAGFHATWDQLVLRGSLDGREFVAFYLNGGRIDATVALNRPRDIRLAMPLIKRRVVVDPKSLGDPDVDLRKLAAA